MTGFPLLFYFGAALVLDKKPQPAADPDLHAARGAEAAWQQAARSGMADKGTQRTQDLQEEHFSKRREFQYCARKFAALQTRLARMEAYVTSSRFKLHREFRNIS
jgi:multidrug resistance efflux pump